MSVTSLCDRGVMRAPTAETYDTVKYICLGHPVALELADLVI